jgi:hypothetical protein
MNANFKYALTLISLEFETSVSCGGSFGGHEVISHLIVDANAVCR